MKLLSPLIWPFVCFVILACNPLAAQTDDDANKAKLEQREQLWERAEEAGNEGKFSEARTLFEQVYTLEESVFGPAHTELLGTLSALAQVAELEKDNDAIIGIRERQHRVTEQLYGKADYRTQDASRAITAAEKDAIRSPEDRNRLQQAVEFNDEVFAKYGEGDFAAAIPVAERVAEIRKQVLGEQHPDYVACLKNLAELYSSLGDYERAEAFYSKATQINKQVLGEQHPSYANSLTVLAELYRLMGNYSTAGPLYSQALEIQRKLLGEQHPEYVNSLNTVASINEKMGEYAQAKMLLTKALEIRKQVLGEQHPDYGTSLNKLATLYKFMGDYENAEHLLIGAIQTQKQILGEEHPVHATTMHILASVYQSMGEYSRAEPLFIRAMEIRKMAIGDQRGDYAASLNNLASLYRDMGNYASAEPLYIQAMEIVRRLNGEQDQYYAASLNNLAILYKRMGDYSRAEPLYMRASEITEQMLGDQHPNFAASLNNLAGLYNSMGDYARAEPLVNRAIEIQKKTVGETHRNYADGLNNLAEIYQSMGEYTRAEKHFIQASEIVSQILGEQHPNFAISMNNIACLYEAMGDHERAEQFYTRAIGNSLRHMDQTSSVLTEQQQIKMIRSLRYQFDNSVSCALQMETHPRSVSEQVVEWKGSVLVRQRGLRLAANDRVIVEGFKQLQVATQHLSALTNAMPAADKLDAWKTQIAELTKERENIETELMRNSADFRAAQKKVTMDDVRQAIPSEGVIVDYLEYNGKAGRSLMATVVSGDGEPMMLDLGSALEASDSIDLWRASLGAGSQAMEAGQLLRKQIWEPLLPHLGDASTVFVSTDGVLGQMPLAAMPGKAEGSYLIEDHAIVMLPVPVLLPALMDRPVIMASQLRTALFMGDVDYGPAATPNTPTTEPQSSAPLLLVSNTRGGLTWSRLPETGREIDSIAQLFAGESVQLRDRDATESAFREAAENAQWLHLATHGFFAPEDKKNALSAAEIAKSQSQLERSDASSSKQSQFVGFSPGQLSGLVFAGANRPPKPIDPLSPDQTIDDGIMTADEIAYMQLENVELAVLSACETGLGETAGGEGILGLQRAFQVAGARSTITSLWQVDDAATRTLMVEFYRNLFERKLSKLESLRQAQLWLLNNPDLIEGRSLTTRGSVRSTKVTGETKTTHDKPTRSLPAYWAAFQLSGDPR